MVEYHGQPYEVGLKYHTRKARKEGQIGFDARYASFYIGKEVYYSLGEFMQYARMDGCRIDVYKRQSLMASVHLMRSRKSRHGITKI